MYGITLCGIRNLRVWIGPLPTFICYMDGMLTYAIIFGFTIFMLFQITLTRFMFICVWKRMKEINDDLLVRVCVIVAIFLSFWMASTDILFSKGIMSVQLCCGKFSKDSIKMDWEEITQTNLPR